MEDYLNGIDEDLMRSINNGSFRLGMLVTVGMSATFEDMITRGNKMQENDKKSMHELLGTLLPVVYNYVRGCLTAKQIWGTLKEKYQCNEKSKKSFVTQCVLELGDFKQKKR